MDKDRAIAKAEREAKEKLTDIAVIRHPQGFYLAGPAREVPLSLQAFVEHIVKPYQ